MSVAAKSVASAPMHTIESVPPPERYARGWHCLGLAADYKDGKPHSLDIFGTRLVCFQGEDGQIRILNAYCPHMGADLGIGAVEGNHLVCKFHGWKWGGDWNLSKDWQHFYRPDIPLKYFGKPEVPE